MKKWIVLISIISSVLFCTACSSPEKEIIGYWMRGDGYTISFTDESSCSFGENESETYKIYDKNHLQVSSSSSGDVREFVFEIDGDTLKIRLATEEEYIEFTKDPDKQKDILDELKKWEEIANEEQMIQSQIDNIQFEIDEYQNKIYDIQQDIEWNNSAIQNNKDDIAKWTEAIDQEYIECQESIDFGDDKEYQENQRDDAIAAHKESIQSCKERITELETKNSKYNTEIEKYQKEIDKLKEEISLLQEEKAAAGD